MKGGELTMKHPKQTAVVSLQHRAIIDWGKRYPIDNQLLDQCAYYPKAGCQYCSFDSPNPECSRSHILSDTRITPASPSIASNLGRSSKRATGKKEAWGISLEKIWEKLPESVRMEVEGVFQQAGMKREEGIR
jgi:hypothetical protein